MRHLSRARIVWALLFAALFGSAYAIVSANQTEAGSPPPAMYGH